MSDVPFECWSVNRVDRIGTRRISQTETNYTVPATHLVQRMRHRTSDLHSAAERSGVVAELLSGTVTRSRYALYLRNLLPAYQAMESALSRYRNRPDLAKLANPSLFRARRIVADLVALKGPTWADSVPLLPSGRRYAARVEWASHSERLIAHCYTRQLGDLSGGQQLARRIVTKFGPDFSAVAFLTFPDIQDLDGFRDAYRRNLDQASVHLSDADGVVEEAAVAFELNIALSCEVGDWCCATDL